MKCLIYLVLVVPFAYAKPSHGHMGGIGGIGVGGVGVGTGVVSHGVSSSASISQVMPYIGYGMLAYPAILEKAHKAKIVGPKLKHAGIGLTKLGNVGIKAGRLGMAAGILAKGAGIGLSGAGIGITGLGKLGYMKGYKEIGLYPGGIGYGYGGYGGYGFKG